jgi:hypothetical protein
VNKLISHFTKVGAALALTGSLTIAIEANAATFKVINTDEPGIGFNDPTPAAPVGLNPGKTVGEQRLIALNFLGGIWAKAIGGNDVIEVAASFAPQECNATNGAGICGTVLGVPRF